MRIGISGWRYAGWRGKFYPKDLPQRRELEFAASKFNSVEINGSFYSLQLPSSYQRWYSETPDDFVFAVKGARFITHMKRLRDVGTPLANFFASGVLALREKLGPRGKQPRDATLVGERSPRRVRHVVDKIDNRLRDVFVYFDNDAKVHAPFDALRLAKRLEIG